MNSIASRTLALRDAPFRVVALTASASCVALCLAWVAAPQLLLTIWDVPPVPAGLLVGRRAGALFLGFGVAFFGIRNAAASPALSAILRGGAVACAALALLGVLEYATGHAGPGIALAAAGEALIAGGLARAARRPA